MAPRESDWGHQTCPRPIHDGFGVVVNSSLGSNDTHRAAQFVDLQTEKGYDARILRAAETEAALLECAAEPARE